MAVTARRDGKPATRVETDSFGPIAVPADRYWGAQTERSLENFRIGGHVMPMAIIRGPRSVKHAAPEGNMDLGRPDPKPGAATVRAAPGVIGGKPHDHLPPL